MPQRWRAASAVLCGLALSIGQIACAREEVVRIDPAGLPFEYFFLAVLRDDGTLSRTSPVFGVAGGRVTFGGEPMMLAEPDETRVLLVGFDRVALSVSYPFFDAARESEMSVSIARAPAAPAPAALTPERFDEGPVPSAVTLIRAGDHEDSATLDRANAPEIVNLLLRVPVDREPCRDREHETFRGLGVRSFLLPRERPIPGELAPLGDPDGPARQIAQLIAVDKDRVLALTARVIYLVRRGADVEIPASLDDFDPSAPSTAFFVDGLGERSIAAAAMALGPRTGAARQVLVAGKYGIGRPAILELSLDEGGLRFVRSASIAEISRNEDEVLGIAIAPDGRSALAGTFAGVLLGRSSSTAPFRPLAVPASVESKSVRHVLATGDPRAPHALAIDGGNLLVGDAFAERWETFKTSTLGELDFTAFAGSEDGGELWAAGGLVTEVYARPREGPWRRVHLEVPPRLGACAAPIGGRFEITQRVRSFALRGEDVFAVPGNCTAILRKRGSCTTAITRDGDAIERTDALELNALAVFGDRLFAGGYAGEVLEVELE